MTTSNTLKNPVIVACFGAPYGVHGWIKVTTYTETPQNLLNYSNWWVAPNSNHTWHPIIITHKTISNSIVRVKPETYDNRDAVAKLTNQLIAVERKQLPELDDNEYYWTDLVGLTVINQQGKTLGNIDYLFVTGANDVIVVKQKSGGSCLIPYIKSVVIKVDLANGQFIVDWEE